MKYLKYFSLLILINSFLFVACSGLNDPGSTATQVTTPTPISPSDNSTNVTQTPTFTWDGAAEKLQISLSYNFAIVNYEINVTGTQSYTIDSGKLSKNQLYFWRVGKSYSDQISWSGSFKFITAP